MGTFRLAAAVAAVLALPSGAAAQKTGDVLYESASFPVWLAVQNVPRAPLVFARVVWDDAESGLRFSTALAAGDLAVTVDGCAHPAAAREHGARGFRVPREDAACRVSDPAAVSVSHRGSPMACTPAKATGARVRRNGEPRYLFFACYWADKPGG